MSVIYNGVIYNGYYGIWNVDWDLVAHLDPDYASKYLTKAEEKGVVPPDQSSAQSIAREHEIRARREADQQLGNAYGRHNINTDDFTEEDKQVLDMMHVSAQPQPPEVPVPRVHIQLGIPAQVANVDEILGVDDNDAEVFVLRGRTTTRQREIVKTRSKYRHGEYFTTNAHSEMAYASVAPSIPSVPLLPLPRRFFAETIQVRVTDDHEYRVHNHVLLDDHSVLHSYRIIEDETFIKLAAYQTIINKVYDTCKNTDAEKNRVVFNKKTGNMYIITWEKKNKKKKHQRLQRVIHGVSNQLNSVSMMMHHFRDHHIQKFINSMSKAVSAKLGVPESQLIQDSFLPTDSDHKHVFAKKIMMLLWQSKVGQIIPWLDGGILESVAGIREAWQAYSPLRSSLGDPKESLFEKPTLGRGFFKALKKKTRPSTIFKFLLGKAYTTATQKLCLAVCSHPRILFFNNVIYFIELMFKNKRLYHFVSNEALSEPKILDALLIAAHEIRFGNGRKANGALFIKYINTLADQKPHLHTEDESEVIKWELFRDTLNMANRYHISINANQLCHYNVVRETHDRLVRFMNRDAAVRREMAHIEFLDFEHPTKDYNGFTFKLLKNADELIEEGQSMKHCVGGYGWRCVAGESIIFSMRRNEVGYVTIELAGEDYRLPISQKYSRHDVTVNNPEILKIIEDWHKDLLKLHRNKEYTYSEQCEIVSRYVTSISSLNDAMTAEMKKTVQIAITNDGEIINKLNLRDYVSRIVSNNEQLSRALSKASQLNHLSVDAAFGVAAPPAMAYDRPRPAAVQAPDIHQMIEDIRNAMDRLEVGNG